jgi:hypothetical protein
MESSVVNDTVSQAYYGIIEKAVTAGTCVVNATYNEANRLRDVFLAESAYTKKDRSLSFSAQSPTKITVEIVGYWKWLEAYFWNNRSTVAGTGSSTTSQKIQTVLTANPNAWSISADYSNIYPNTMTVYNVEKDNKTALTVIQAAVACGDVAGNPWVFAILNGRKAYYNAIPTVTEYEYHLVNNRQMLFYAGTSDSVKPWDINAGRWYRDRDLAALIPSTSSIMQDKTMSFIQSVRYIAPFSYELQEGQINTLAQLLAVQNLGVM